MEEKKQLGYLNHIGLGVGSAIGTGIFMMLGFGIAYTGRSIVLVCAAGCFLMLLAFWYAGAMGTLFVLKGGDYTARSMVFPPLLTGVSAWAQRPIFPLVPRPRSRNAPSPWLPGS